MQGCYCDEIGRDTAETRRSVVRVTTFVAAIYFIYAED